MKYVRLNKQVCQKLDMDKLIEFGVKTRGCMLTLKDEVLQERKQGLLPGNRHLDRRKQFIQEASA